MDEIKEKVPKQLEKRKKQQNAKGARHLQPGRQRKLSSSRKQPSEGRTMLPKSGRDARICWLSQPSDCLTGSTMISY